MDIQKIKTYVQGFVRERDWEPYQSPKNLAMGIAVEASELMEHFIWISEQESWDLAKPSKKKEEIQDEIGDVIHCLVHLANALDIDLEEAFWSKMKKTEAKYPVELAKGKKVKYTELPNSSS